jgi:hypothetical protein
MDLPNCQNFIKCGQKGFVYVNGKIYCGNCISNAQKRMREQEEKFLTE